MAAVFNPYQEWLGINDPQRPPNHYVLLGLTVYESDPERISDAAMRQMAYVLEHDPGEHEWARRLFDELDAARTCLSDVEQKAAYDADLRRQRFLAEFALRNQGLHGAAGATTATHGNGAARDGGEPSPADQFAVLKPHEQLRVVPHPTLLNDHGSGAYSFPAAKLRGAESKPAAPADKLRVEVSPKLLTAVIGGVAAVACAIVAVFAWLQREPPEVDPLPALVAALNETDPKARVAACKQLATLGPKAGDAVHALVNVLRKDDDDKVRLAAVEALAQTGAMIGDAQRELAELAAREPHPVVKQRMQALAGAK